MYFWSSFSAVSTPTFASNSVSQNFSRNTSFIIPDLNYFQNLSELWYRLFILDISVQCCQFPRQEADFCKLLSTFVRTKKKKNTITRNHKKAITSCDEIYENAWTCQEFESRTLSKNRFIWSLALPLLLPYAHALSVPSTFPFLGFWHCIPLYPW